jgi:protein-tyrosine phosphatase
MIQDAGDVPLTEGRRMRTGLVYRISGALAGPDELAELTATGLRTVVDLRHQNEDRSAVVGWAKSAGADYFNFPIVLGNFLGNQRGRDSDLWKAVENGTAREYMLDSYATLGIGFGAQLVGGLECLARGFPAGFGCAAGKDRTGIMSAYLQILLGATEETAIESYLDRAPTVEQLKPQVAFLYDVDVHNIPEGMLYIMEVRAEMLQRALDAVRELGGVEKFLRDHGLTDETVDRLHGALVEPAR